MTTEAFRVQLHGDPAVEQANGRSPDRIHVPDAAGRRHIPELDSLRGVAAAVVVLNHFHLAWLRAGAPSWITHFRLNPLLWLLVDGHASVILFFLLSGFVLMLPFLRGSEQGYCKYVLRRFLRIYPPYVAALAVAVVACAHLAGKPSLGNVLTLNWPSLPDSHSVLQHLALVRRVEMFRYNNPVWSLVHEARISLLFPFIAVVALRLGMPAVLGVAGVCSLVTPYLLHHFESTLSESMHMTAWSYTLKFCGIFLMGAALACRRDEGVALLERLPRYGRALLFSVALALYLYPIFGWQLLERGDFCSALGGMVLLTFAMRRNGTVARLLRVQPVHYLGKISYSLYLIHMPVLLALCALVPRGTPFWWILLPYLAISLAAALLLHRLVEAPSILWCKRVARIHLPVVAWRWSGPSPFRLPRQPRPEHTL